MHVIFDWASSSMATHLKDGKTMLMNEPEHECIIQQTIQKRPFPSNNGAANDPIAISPREQQKIGIYSSMAMKDLIQNE